MARRNILVCGGGGVKGMMQITALAEKERQLGDLTDFFDLMIGTSVGSINTGAIAQGMPAYKLAEMYPKLVRRMFKKKPWHKFPKLPLYDREVFYSCWREMFKKCMIERGMFLKFAKTKLLITSLNVVDNKNHYFKSWEKKDGKLPFELTIARSFAAPMFFGYMIDSNDMAIWADGGCGTSNISLDEALTESMLQNWFLKDEVHFYVFGCGFSDPSKTFYELKNYKSIRQLMRWIAPTAGGIARIQSREEQISRMEAIATRYDNVHFTYYDTKIPKKMDAMDKLQYLDDYKQLGYEMVKKPLIKI